MLARLESRRSGRLYWGTWGSLLVLTGLMLLIDSSPMPRVAFVAVLLGAMLVKAALIGAHFMHLRFERASLALMVIVGLLLTGVILFVLIVPDAIRIAGMRNR